jgi:hypothetical protein
MGASYSYNVNLHSVPPSPTSLDKENIKEDLNENKEIFVIFLDDKALCYSYKFNTIFEKASSIKNKICHNLMTTHGSTFNINTKEDTDNSSFYNAVILTRETNCLNSTESIHQSIRILKLKHIEYNIDGDIEEALVNKLYDDEESTNEEMDDNNEDTSENESEDENDTEPNNHYEVHEEKVETEETEENNKESDKTE